MPDNNLERMSPVGLHTSNSFILLGLYAIRGRFSRTRFHLENVGSNLWLKRNLPVYIWQERRRSGTRISVFATCLSLGQQEGLWLEGEPLSQRLLRAEELWLLKLHHGRELVDESSFGLPFPSQHLQSGPS